jgi:hypothetical protein
MRVTLRVISSLVVCAAFAACSEPTATTNSSARSFSPAPAFSFSSAGSPGVSSQQLTLTSKGGSFNLGLFSVNFPANAVCDPGQSSYGPTEWDKPCVTLGDNQSLTLTASVSLGLNGLGVDFGPDVRFSPDAQVTLSTDIFARFITGNRAYYAAHPDALRAYALLYTRSLGGDRTPDYVTDPSAITHIDMQTGRVWRRIKHFSGYSVTTGLACSPSPDDPDCIEVDNPAIGTSGK